MYGEVKHSSKISEHITHIGSPGIAYAVGWHGDQILEEMIAEHMLLYLVSGEIRLFEAESDRIYATGEIIFVRRNHLVKCGRHPLAAEQSYNLILFVLDRKLLEDFSIKYNVSADHAAADSDDGLTVLKESPELLSLFKSLEPYRQSAKPLPQAIRRHKLEEAILALLEQGENMAKLLFDFTDPGKIDLKAFMMRNYMFNITIRQFARLTGRSLSTFQRDFKKIFDMKASQWLLSQRLNQAHWNIEVEGRKPIDIYLELGFADFSHFSRSFKKKYGYSATDLAGRKPGNY